MPVACALPVARALAVAVPERGRRPPGLEGLLIPPAGNDEPRGAAVGRLQQLEPLEAVLVVHRPGPRGEPAGQLVPAVGRHRNCVDLHDGHAQNDASRAGACLDRLGAPTRSPHASNRHTAQDLGNCRKPEGRLQYVNSEAYGGMVRVPWWGIASSGLAPVLLIAGWTIAADLQPTPFDAVSRSISTLAADGMPYRWIVTIAILGVGVCNILTGLALVAAADGGRMLLMAGGVCSILIAANPQPLGGGSLAHETSSFLGTVIMTLWPVAAIRPAPDAPLALRPRVAWAAVGVNLALLLWFTPELFNGAELGLAERAVTAYQALWPFVVVVSVVIARPRTRQPVLTEASVRNS
jgi:hypothetical membrane protein